MSRFGAWMGAMLLAGVAAGAGQAATMQAVYRGTVINSDDPGNRFGAGTSLDGLSFSAVFIYDPETPGSSRTITPTSDTVAGGSSLGIRSPMRSAKLTINGHTEAFRPSFSAEVGTIKGLFSRIVHRGVHVEEREHGQARSGLQAFAEGRPDLIPVSLDSSIPLTPQRPPDGFGSFSFLECTFDPAGDCAYDLATLTNGNLVPSSVRVAPIPVPAALPLLVSALAGFGFVALRRRRAGMRAAV